MRGSLFRKEALSYQKEQSGDRLLIARPFSHFFLTVLLLLVVAAGFIFLFSHSYYRKQAVMGQLVSDKPGIIVGPSDNGRIKELNVEINDAVAVGQQLFTIQRDEMVVKDRPFSDGIWEKIEQRKHLIYQQIELESESLIDLQSENRQQQVDIEERIGRLDRLIENESRLLALREFAYERLNSLFEQQLISQSSLEMNYVEYLQQQNSLENLEIRRAELVQQAKQLESDYSILGIDVARRQLALRSDLSTLEQEQFQVEAEGLIETVAPASGVIDTINAGVGDFVPAHQTVIVIRPNDAILEAELFVPSSAIGFISEGQVVNIRLDAYPYQKFGMQFGVVSFISNSLLLAEELPGNQNIQGPVYKVKVELESQSIQAFGEKIELRPGIQLEANIILEQRSLLEWLLEPLYSV